MKFNIPNNCQIPCLEQIYREHFYKEKESFTGTFIEVGAYDGYNYSNTYPLASLGWRGYYFEPIPHLAEACRRNHANHEKIEVIESAVGSSEGLFEIAVADTLSTLSEEQFKAYEEIDWAIGHLKVYSSGKITVPVIRLENAVESLGIKNVDLLVIDVEGAEESVLLSFDLKRMSPRMIICEIEDDHLDFRHRKSIYDRNVRVRSLIESCGYRSIYRDHINTVFLLEESSK